MDITFQEVMLSITAENTTESGNKTIIEKSFNITLDTIIAPPNVTTDQATTDQAQNASGTLTQNNGTHAGEPQQPLEQQTSQVRPAEQQQQQVGQQQAGQGDQLGLEPAQQIPNDAAIEQQIENGSGGQQQSVGDQTQPSTNNEIEGNSPESIIAVEQQPQEQQLAVPAEDVRSVAIGEPGISEPRDDSTTVKASDMEPIQGQQAQTEGQELPVQVSPEQAGEQVAEVSQSQLAQEGQPEARQRQEEEAGELENLSELNEQTNTEPNSGVQSPDNLAQPAGLDNMQANLDPVVSIKVTEEESKRDKKADGT